MIHERRSMPPEGSPQSPEPRSDVTRELYLDLLIRCLTDSIYDEAGRPARAEGLDWPSRAHSMIGLRRLENIRRCVEDVLAREVPGDLIETGVWRGGAVILMRAVLKAHGDPDGRIVWAADSFAGLPPPDAARYPHDAGDPHHSFAQLAVSLADVRENFRKYGLLDDRVRFLPGWFRDTLPDAPIDRLALLRLDGDMYESTMDGLVHLYDKVSPGGYVIVDDYGCVPACRQAVHDFRDARKILDPIQPVDWAGIYWQKSSCERSPATLNPSVDVLPTATPASMQQTSPKPGLASVIIPCHNQLEFTTACVDALLRHTRSPWELIVVDNGSTDGTAAYLESIRSTAPVRVEVVTNPENRGFPAACNQGLKAARGDYLVLLNNDAVVTDGWLDQLVALAESDPAIGLTGPMSNYAPPPQLVEHVTYADLAGMHDFAARWRAERRGTWLTVEKLSGFCLLLKRSVLEAVGGLDERFGLGFFDDDDLALRARKAGFTLAVAHDLFVHHFGSRTFVGAGIDAEALLGENQARFAAKWGLPELQGRRVSLRPWSAPAPSSSARPRVTLTMIVRNEESNLSACLESAQGLFDEIVVVDTGSADRTREIARSFGARVFDFVWVDDFAAARNAALARATGDYAFWLDADDVIDPPQRERVQALIEGLGRAGESAYVVRCACDPDREGGGGETVVDHIRLFPLREDIRWSYRVHEQILPALRRGQVPVRWTDVTVRHTGYTDPALRRRKLARDEAILLDELAERPGEPFLLFNIGSIAIERQDWRAALDALRGSLDASAPTDSITRKLYALIARAHQMLGEPREALAACASGLAVDSDDAELLFREAVIRRNIGDSAGAEACWRRVLTLRRPEQFSSVDQGIYGHLTRRNLAVLAEERGDPAEADRLWAEVLAECPGDREALAARGRLAERIDPASIAWLIPGSRRRVVPPRGPGDFDPYMPVASAWVRALDARVVVELGVRTGASTRALLAGVHAVGGQVWGVDLEDRHGIVDARFTFLRADAADVADRWAAIDLLHVDTDPHTEEQTLRWFELYAERCRAIALHDAHHPDFGVGAAVKAFAGAGGWRVFEYWGNPSGWTVLVREGEPTPPEEMLP